MFGSSVVIAINCLKFLSEVTQRELESVQFPSIQYCIITYGVKLTEAVNIIYGLTYFAHVYYTCSQQHFYLSRAFGWKFLFLFIEEVVISMGVI